MKEIAPRMILEGNILSMNRSAEHRLGSLDVTVDQLAGRCPALHWLGSWPVGRSGGQGDFHETQGEVSVKKARPHPGLLPQGEGAVVAAFLE